MAWKARRTFSKWLLAFALVATTAGAEEPCGNSQGHLFSLDFANLRKACFWDKHLYLDPGRWLREYPELTPARLQTYIPPDRWSVVASRDVVEGDTVSFMFIYFADQSVAVAYRWVPGGRFREAMRCLLGDIECGSGRDGGATGHPGDCQIEVSSLVLTSQHDKELQALARRLEKISLRFWGVAAYDWVTELEPVFRVSFYGFKTHALPLDLVFVRMDQPELARWVDQVIERLERARKQRPK